MTMSRLDVFVVVLAFLTSCFAQNRGRFYLLNKKIGNVETALKDEISVLVSEMTNLYAELEKVQSQCKANNDSADMGTGDTPSTSDFQKQLQYMSSEIHQLKSSLQTEKANQHECSHTVSRLQQAFGAEKFARRRLQSEVKELTAMAEANKEHLVSMATELSNLKSSVSELKYEISGNYSMAVGQLDELTTTLNGQTVRLFKVENDTRVLYELAAKAGDSISTLSTHFNATRTDRPVPVTTTHISQTTQVVPSAVPTYGPELAALMKVGVKVVRGKDWKWGDQDEGNVGTVIERKGGSEPGWVWVLWSHEDRNRYRMGYNGAYDLILA